MALDLNGAGTRASRVGDGPATAGDAVAQPVVGRRILASRRRQIVASVVILAALVLLAVEGLSNATIYFKTADQAVAAKTALGTRVFRIEGMVDDDVTQVGSTVHFDLTSNGVTVPIVDTQSPPQLFRPGIPVVLEGHWQGAVYASDRIMVKHTASYTEAHPDRVKGQPGRPTPTGGGL